MNQFAILCLLCTSILGACAVGQVSVTTEQIEDLRLANLIAQVKDTPASQLDHELPAVGLSDWLLAQAGPDAKIVWSYRPPHDGLEWGNPHFCSDCVQAFGTRWDGRSFFVLIANDTDAGPTFYSGHVLVPKKGIANVPQLSDLPRLLWKVPKNSTRAEAKR